jgi:trehalose synthase
MQGVMEGFTKLFDRDCPVKPELVLAGPNVTAVADDPEGAQVFEDVVDAWRALPHAMRNRVHLASLPVADIEENAAIVNALQRHAAIVVQKSLEEGFGLTVTEAMWKGRPVVASAVGGIQDQIEDGVNGVLLKDPEDLETFAEVLCDLLCDPDRSAQLGAAAKDRVRERFLGIDHLLHYAELLKAIDSD